MADYIATARSNYFKVKDEDAFEEWCKELELGLIRQGDKVGFTVETDHGTLPGFRYDEDKGDDVEIDLAQELAEHLVEGEVAVVMEAGAEKMRYVLAYAFAVNSKGETREIYLNQINELAKELGENVTACEY